MVKHDVSQSCSNATRNLRNSKQFTVVKPSLRCDQPKRQSTPTFSYVMSKDFVQFCYPLPPAFVAVVSFFDFAFFSLSTSFWWTEIFDRPDWASSCLWLFGSFHPTTTQPQTPSELWAKRITKLNEKIANCTNSFVARFSQVWSQLCKQHC